MEGNRMSAPTPSTTFERLSQDGGGASGAPPWALSETDAAEERLPDDERVYALAEQPVYPYMRMVAAPRGKRRHARRALVSAAMTLALIGICAGGSLFAYSRASAMASQEQRTLDLRAAVDGFCFDLRQQDYNDAYVFLAPSVQAHLSLDAFVAGSQRLDSAEGVVTECREPASGSHLAVTPATGSDRIEIIRNGVQTAGTLRFVRQGSDWKISAIDPALAAE